MKQATFFGNARIEIQEVAEPVPGPGEVKIAVAYCCICGSDSHMFFGPLVVNGPHPLSGKAPPFPLGHEVSGVVTEVGVEVTRFKPGDRVAVQPVVSCGHCYACQKGWYNLCQTRGMIGGTQPGGMAEYLCVSEHQVFPIASEMPLLDAALVQCGAFPFGGVMQSGMTLGDSCAIIGAGTCGLMAVQAAKAAGASEIIVTDRSDAKLHLAKQMGATQTLNVTQEDVRTEVLEYTGGIGVDYAFDTVGMDNTLDEALACIRPNGTVMVMVNDYDYTERYSFACHDFWNKQAVIKCAFSPYVGQYAKMVELARTRVMDARSLVTRIIALEDVERDGFLALEQEQDQIKIVIKIHDFE